MPKNLKITRSITSCIQPLKDASICLIAAQNGPTSLHIHWHFDPLWAKPNHVKLIVFLARLRWGSKFCATFPSVKKKTWGCLCNFRLVSKKTLYLGSWVLGGLCECFARFGACCQSYVTNVGLANNAIKTQVNPVSHRAKTAELLYK